MARILSAVWRLAGVALTLTLFAPAYLCGGAFESVRSGWRTGRRDAKWLTSDPEG